MIWLDAVVPAGSGTTTTSAELRSRLVGPGCEGRLAAWPTWWTAAELAAELPDEQLRTAVSAQARELPADFYDIAVPVPGSWPDGDVRYVQLSPGYAGHATQARARGWAVAGDGGGTHLDVAGRPTWPTCSVEGARRARAADTAAQGQHVR